MEANKKTKEKKMNKVEKSILVACMNFMMTQGWSYELAVNAVAAQCAVPQSVVRKVFIEDLREQRDSHLAASKIMD